jgi:hypothetical protein
MISGTAFFLRLMGYMDKEVGQSINKVEKLRHRPTHTVDNFQTEITATPTESTDYSDDGY